jgi:O-acetyl-ADP-ribose deacetylase (regulator of RNase III)
MKILVKRGDITTEHVDAIVNAANPELVRGGGVCGAIHAAGGGSIADECEAIRGTLPRKRLPVGSAVVTGGGRLPARWVIHAVGPVYGTSDRDASLLASAYADSLKRAEEVGARTVAFPAISCGIYGYPVDEAARIAIRAVKRSRAGVDEVRFVLFDDMTLENFEEAFAEIEGGG